MSPWLTAVAVLAVAAGAGPRAVRVPRAPRDRSRLERWVTYRAVAADLPHLGQRPLVLWSASALAGSLPLVVLGPAPLTVAWLVIGCSGPPLVVLVRGDRRHQMLGRQLPALVDGVSRQLRVGRSLPQALTELRRDTQPPLDRDLAEIVRRVGQGRLLADELSRWADRYDDLSDLRLVVTALTLGQRTGGAHAVALDSVARALRDRRAVAGELHALTAQARASASVVAAAPIGFAAGLWALGLSPAVDWDRPVVMAALALGLVLDAVGLWWMRRLTRPRW